MYELDQETRARWERLSATNVSDALDALGLPGATRGIRPLSESWRKLVGCAVTLRLTVAGETAPRTHLGVNAIAAARAGDVIVIDNQGRLDTSCWGGILAAAAKLKGLSGTVIDGCCRDLDECREADYPVFARGTVVQTARGRVVEESTNAEISCGGARVRPGDLVLGDSSGVVFVPRERLAEVLDKAEELWQKEEAMLERLRQGVDILTVDGEAGYNAMLRK
ncbi:MAG: RraA family protein [Firmicutes bacterium]|nr:RraA family protein [Bacillota bacterium]